MAKDKAKDFNRSVENFYARMKKYSTIKGATYSKKFYDIEEEIRSAKRGERNIDEVINKLDSIRGKEGNEMINIYNPKLDRMTPLGDTFEKDIKYKHDLYELELDDISQVIIDNPELFKTDDISQEQYEEMYREYYEEYDTALLREVWDWLDRRPTGIVKDVLFDLADLIRKYGEHKVAKYMNERQEDIPLLNSYTGYDDIVELQNIISDISNLIELDESRNKRMSERVEEYETF